MEDDTLRSAERQSYTTGHGHTGESSAEPDVLLDVPQLRVEEIILDVDDLRAHVSVQADVLNLLRLSVGADVQLGGVHLEIRGVEAQALLKVRLDKVAEIINRVLSTIDRNPEIVDQIVSPLGGAINEVGRTAERSVGEVTGALEGAELNLNSPVAEVTEELNEPGDQDEEDAVAEAPQDDVESDADEGTRRPLRRRRRQERNADETPP